MPNAWMLGPLIIQRSFVFLGVSLLLGVILFQVLSPFSKSYVKQLTNEISSFFFAFVISIWIAKIVVNIGTFMNDPRAVLAYPSNSHAFYLAFAFILPYSKLHVYRRDLNINHIGTALFYVFILSSIFFEFSNTVVEQNVAVHVSQLGILVATLIILLGTQNSLTRLSLYIGITVFTVGYFVLSSIFAHTHIFLYTVDTWFWVISLIIVSLLWFRLYPTGLKTRGSNR
ncbi:hypothetical protein GLW08_06615 [Pontibacillus yanchengensis]|uniref:Uncharacterized protein n=2 Tax=Pontibacillus yanchengensis TaxID=462910 RepID=A0A6I5A2X2_9BACI|nr:hypothetical protein [Pontibacillus yanchengensis]MYL32429.1 hypothetical protein [Pontibacillus yanchengensis]MYL53010.1 hypothetical protein [Pontibacillus yanchengensis]